MVALRHDASGLRVWTLGHSSRPIDELLAALRACNVRVLADVRRRPASRRHAQFNQGALEKSLSTAGVSYRGMPTLGGFRDPAGPTAHRALKTPALRAYAQYMATDAFGGAIDELLAAAREAPTAVMCAERDWRACHRSLIADYLHAAGAQVIHIDGPGRCDAHLLSPGARIVQGRIDYDGPQRELL